MKFYCDFIRAWIPLCEWFGAWGKLRGECLTVEREVKADRRSRHYFVGYVVGVS